MTVTYDEITSLEVGGPGETQRGGGFFGGGFGLQGAAEGMLIAAALNLLTTRSRIQTVVCVQTLNAEVFFSIGDEKATDLRMRLSSVFSELRKRAALRQSSAHSPHRDLVERLQALAEMRTKDLLTAEEFETLKRELLGERQSPESSPRMEAP